MARSTSGVRRWSPSPMAPAIAKTTRSPSLLHCDRPASRRTICGEDHAVAAARLDGHWLMLDNRRMAMVEDGDVRNYRPLFVIDQSAVMRYVDTPLLAGMPGRDPAPSAALSSAVQPGLISFAN